MNNFDQELFEYFYDLSGILNMKDEGKPGNLCETLFNSCEKSLQENLYSDINIQDSKGNTFLHILLHYTNSSKLALKYAMPLLSKGANPLILNYNQQNCLQYGRNETINELWKGFDNLSINNNFVDQTCGFNQEFKQLIFDNCYKDNSFFDTTEQLVKFLQDNSLYNHSNLAKVFATNVGLSLKETIPFFRSLETTTQKNTVFLKEILCASGADVYLNRKDNSEVFKDFVYNTQFTIDHQFLTMLEHHKLSNITGKTENWKDKLFTHFVELIVANNTDIHKKHTVQHQLAHKEMSYADFFENSIFNPYFYSLKLDKELPNKDNIIKKKKI